MWSDDVTIFKPHNVRKRIPNGFNSQLHQSSLLHTDVLQLIGELGTDQRFFC